MSPVKSVHPLDPLSEAEIAAAAAIVKAKGGLDGTAWFETITLDEPSKDELAGHAAGTAVSRRAYVCCYEPSSNRTFNGVADLGGGQLIGWRHVPGAQARIVTDEFVEGGRIALADEGVKAALAKRGITDTSKVLVEPWAAGDFGIASEKGERIAYGHCWAMNEAGDNPYGRPIANLHPVIDLRRGKVVRIDDYGVVPLPPGDQAIERNAGCAKTSSRSTSSRRTVRALPSRACWFAGRNGASGWASTCARASCCTRSAMRTAGACAPSCTAPRWLKWWCPMAIPQAPISAATPSIPANTASASSSIR